MSQVQLVINWRRRVPSGIFKIIANEMLKEEINTDNKIYVSYCFSPSMLLRLISSVKITNNIPAMISRLN